jgi:DNA mismatch endonuclease, patch repair protein
MNRRTDTVSRAKRSDIMRAVRSHGNKATELVLVHIFRAHHITGWRRQLAVSGNPDFVFRRERLAVFVDGCFWHGCSKHCRMPKGNANYWKEKIASNKWRDRLVTRTLRKLGWSVLRIWEHDLVRKNQAGCVEKVRAFLEG